MLRNVSIVFDASLIAEVEHLFLRERTRIRTSRDLVKGLSPNQKGNSGSGRKKIKNSNNQV